VAVQVVPLGGMAIGVLGCARLDPEPRGAGVRGLPLSPSPAHSDGGQGNRTQQSTGCAATAVRGLTTMLADLSAPRQGYEARRPRYLRINGECRAEPTLDLDRPLAGRCLRMAIARSIPTLVKVSRATVYPVFGQQTAWRPVPAAGSA
jgi:hypothetical protein